MGDFKNNNGIFPLIATCDLIWLLLRRWRFVVSNLTITTTKVNINLDKQEKGKSNLTWRFVLSIKDETIADGSRK